MTRTLAALFFALLVVHGVERNPGPGQENDKGGAGAAAGKGNTGPGSRTRQAAAANEPSLSDIMAKLISMESMKDDIHKISENVASMRKDFESLKKTVNVMQNEIDGLRTEVDTLERHNRELWEENQYLNDTMESMGKNLNLIDTQMRRNNLIVFGLSKEETDSKGCMKVVSELLNGKMGVRDVEIEHAHRLGKGTNSPVLIKCRRSEDKKNILKAKLKLKGTKVYIDEDYSQNTREVRRILIGKMKEMKEQGKEVKLKHDHLVVDGVKLYLDNNGVNLIQKQ